MIWWCWYFVAFPLLHLLHLFHSKRNTSFEFVYSKWDVWKLISFNAHFPLVLFVCNCFIIMWIFKFVVLFLRLMLASHQNYVDLIFPFLYRFRNHFANTSHLKKTFCFAIKIAQLTAIYSIFVTLQTIDFLCCFIPYASILYIKFLTLADFF